MQLPATFGALELSVVIITFNEERNIARCLASVKEVADDIVVVDSFSTDATEKIVREHGARFVQHAFAGHIEQKNWTVVRRCVGYYRYDTPRELDLLNQLWPLESTRVNLLLPQQKLATKTRTGAKVTKTYDTATTPYQRLLRDHPGLLHPTDAALLAARLTGCNPAQLAREIDLIQRNLTELARHRGQIQRRAKANAVYLSRTKMTRPAKGTQPPGSSARHPTLARSTPPQGRSASLRDGATPHP